MRPHDHARAVLATAAFLFLLLVTQAVRADDPPPCSKSVPMRYGDSVSCKEGVLFPPTWAVDAVRVKTILLPKCQADLVLVEAIRDADAQEGAERLLACQDYARTQERLLDKALDISAPGVPWYKSPILWGVVGAVAGAAAAGGIAYGVTR